jgi:hypothetical protein
VLAAARTRGSAATLRPEVTQDALFGISFQLFRQNSTAVVWLSIWANDVPKAMDQVAILRTLNVQSDLQSEKGVDPVRNQTASSKFCRYSRFRNNLRVIEALAGSLLE